MRETKQNQMKYSHPAGLQKGRCPEREKVALSRLIVPETESTISPEPVINIVKTILGIAAWPLASPCDLAPPPGFRPCSCGCGDPKH